jgi:hypothetical protein
MAVRIALGGFPDMTHVTYQIVEHDGGWAYKVGDVFSETFPTRELAHAAAAEAAQEQRAPGETRPIEYEDRSGHWREETSQGDDRPDSEVKD